MAMNKVVLNASSTVTRVATMTDKAAIRQIRANAERRHQWEVVKACIQRLAELGTPTSADPLVRRYREVMAATEELIGRPHSRTNQKFARLQARGIPDKEIVKEIISELIKRKTPANGFLRLMQLGAPELTFEAVAVEFAQEFSAEVVAAAKVRLAQ
jgi:hypothetical protein